MTPNFIKMMFCLFSIALLSLFSCVSSQYKPAEDMVTLDVTFVDASWDGKKIPNGQQCNKFGGNGATPALRIKNIPTKANALIFEYSDQDNDRMNYGGHGKIRYAIKPGSTQVTVPSVPGHTFELPDNFSLISAHANPGWDKAGAYMPPCSGGRGNRYYVTVKAVYDTPDKKDSLVLGERRLNLGKY
ncbi:hypothetical protein [Desulfobacula sp.]|uniref:hypothetical protein n=1 Tax=Desulfobacula sp. TaxID=2593537 RepID=UPI002634FE30|nr:hypothetical protein [Desulfobacula sp.]